MAEREGVAFRCEEFGAAFPENHGPGVNKVSGPPPAALPVYSPPENPEESMTWNRR